MRVIIKKTRDTQTVVCEVPLVRKKAQANFKRVRCSDGTIKTGKSSNEKKIGEGERRT